MVSFRSLAYAVALDVSSMQSFLNGLLRGDRKKKQHTNSAHFFYNALQNSVRVSFKLFVSNADQALKGTQVIN